MKLVFLGPPGAGKGTIAYKCSSELGMQHISTGDIFRSAIKDRNEIGLRVKKLIDEGKLVPDDLTTKLIRKRINDKEDFILDGFPRTINQAMELEKMSLITRVINFRLSDAEIVKRLSGRRICSKCGKSFHIDYIPPKEKGKCDYCGGELYIREDDSKKSIINRIKVYRKKTRPLIEYYENKKILTNIDASLSADGVFSSLKNHLSALQNIKS